MMMSNNERATDIAVSPNDVPRFALFGEHRRAHENEGLNVDMLGAPSRLKHTWRIRPHGHPDFHHLMWIDGGGGVLQLEGRKTVLNAPCVLGLPPGAVHGFKWNAHISGFVVTTARLSLRDRVPAENVTLFEHPFSLNPSPALRRQLGWAFREFFREFTRQGPGRQAGLTACLLWIVSILAQQEELVLGDIESVSTETQLVARFRARIEATYRDRLKLEDYCEHLTVTPIRLRRACSVVTGRSPLRLIHDRLIQEAKRLLVSTAASVSEVGFVLGFDDPANFSRFFYRNVRMWPSDFRERHPSEETHRKP